MTSKIKGTEGVEFPDSTVQGSAAYTKAQADALLAQGPAFRAINAVNQGVVPGAWTQVTLGQEDFDTNNCFSGGVFTPNVAGYYQIDAAVHHNSSGLTAASTQIWKNGSPVASSGPAVSAGGPDQVTAISTLVYFNGTTDNVSLHGYQTGGTTNLFANGLTWMSGFLARRAAP